MRRIFETVMGLGKRMDERPEKLGGDTIGMRLAAEELRIRDREGKPRRLKANRAQRAFEAARGGAILC